MLQTKTLLLVSLLFLFCDYSSSQECELVLPNPANNFSYIITYPLLLRPGTTEFHYPSHLRRNQQIVKLLPRQPIELVCPGENQDINQLNSSTAIAICLENGELLLPEGPRNFDFNNLHCKKEPTYSVRDTGETCNRANHIKKFSIGFKLDNWRFLTTMNVCFDMNSKDPVYSHFTLSKHINSVPRNKSDSRPAFIETESLYRFHPRTSLYQLYQKRNQRRTINRQLGRFDEDKTIIRDDESYFLSKGHLTAKSDFVYEAQQRSTFFYINTAPQWQSVNGGNWNNVEKDVRSYAERKRVDLEIYTGIFGTHSLMNRRTDGTEPLFLYDQEGRKAVRVPEQFWKLVYEPRTKAAVVIFGLNNPFVTIANPICDDVSPLISWLQRVEKGNSLLGDVYCCTYEEARRKIGQMHFPHINVDGLLTE